MSRRFGSNQKECLISLSNKYNYFLKIMKENLKIVSVFALNWIKGAIFIEAEEDLEIN